MLRIKIIYDKYNRTFKLLDKGFGALLNDGDVFELLLPLTSGENQDEELIDATALAHA